MKRKFLLVIIALLPAVIFYSCEKEEERPPIPPPAPPVADFTYEITNHATRTVKFTNTSTYAQSYSWLFGDAGTSTQISPEHSYPSYGNYTVRLTANGEGGTNTATKTVAVTP